MSLKVYTGIKFKSKNLNEILGQLNSIKEQAIKNVIEYYINNPVQIEEFIQSKNFDESYINKVTDCISEQKVNNDTMYTFVKSFKSSMAKDNIDWTDIHATFIVHIIPYKGNIMDIILLVILKKMKNCYFSLQMTFIIRIKQINLMILQQENGTNEQKFGKLYSMIMKMIIQDYNLESQTIIL